MSPPRIISFLPAATELLSALGLEPCILGRSHECDFPPSILSRPVVTQAAIDTEALSSEIHKAVNRRLAQALSVFEIDFDRVRALHPTHLVTQHQCDVCSVGMTQINHMLAEANLTNVRTVDFSPATWPDWLHAIAELGDVFNCRDAAQVLIQSILDRAEHFQARTRGIEGRQKVICLEWLEPMIVSGHWIPEMIETAGGNYLGPNSGQRSIVIDKAQLEEWDPDVVLISPCGFDLNRAERELDALPNHHWLFACRAFNEGHAYLINGWDYVNRPGLRLIDTLEIFARIINPLRFASSFAPDGWTRLQPKYPSAR